MNLSSWLSVSLLKSVNHQAKCFNQILKMIHKKKILDWLTIKKYFYTYNVSQYPDYVFIQTFITWLSICKLPVWFSGDLQFLIQFLQKKSHLKTQRYTRRVPSIQFFLSHIASHALMSSSPTFDKTQHRNTIFVSLCTWVRRDTVCIPVSFCIPVHNSYK